MKKIVNKIRKNIKVITAFVLGIFFASSAVYGATILFQSDEVGYDNTYSEFKDNNGNDVEDVQTALDLLYTKASTCSIRNICPVGMKRIDTSNGEYSCVNPKSPRQYIIRLNTEGETISTTDHVDELRFIGKNPNNYVRFNNQVWRIIGIFDGRLKLVSSPIGNYSYDTSSKTVNNGLGVNEWSQADLMKLLNPGYESNSDLKCKTNTSSTTENGYTVINCGDNSSDAYTTETVNNSLYWNAGSGLCYNYGNYQATNCDFTTSGLTDTTSKNMIDTVTWYLGSNDKSDDLWGANEIMTADYLYNMERSGLNGKQCSNTYYCSDTVTRTTRWSGKVGLIYPSDYAFATSGGTTYDRATCLSKQVGYVSSSTTPNWSNTYTDCKNNDWLYNSNIFQWTLSPRAYSSYAGSVLGVNSAGRVGYYLAYNADEVSPVVFLKSSISITGGDGSSTNPYTIG